MLLLGVGVIHLLERTELVSGEKSVTVLHSSYKTRDRGKNDTGTEREKENDRGRPVRRE
jgi:hypothetical protein